MTTPLSSLPRSGVVGHRFFLVVLAAGLLWGCANQAEGERCERSNDNTDCESGLECVSLQTLTGDSTGAVCCPRSNPSTQICQQRPIDLDTGDDDEPEPTSEPDPSDDDAPAPMDAGSDGDAGADAGG